MATKDQVIFLHRQNPLWSANKIAAYLHCESAYIRATARRNHLRLPPANVSKAKIFELGEACLEAGLTLGDINRLKSRQP